MGNPVASKATPSASMNDLIENGIYNMSNTDISDKVSELGYPDNHKYWNVVVFVKDDWIHQYATKIANKGVYSRSSGDGVSWTEWIRLDNFGCNTLSDLANELKPLLGLS